MKPFSSFLASQLTAYVAYRKSLGFSTKALCSHLHAFDQYLEKQKKAPAVLPPSFFLELRADLNIESRSVNRILSTTRMFFGYLVRSGEYTLNPVKDIPLLPENEIIPFIFSEKQVDQLLLAVCKAIRKDTMLFIKDFSVYLAVFLLARCGLRISEPLRMMKHHYRRPEKTLYIEKTKFKKDRLIPIPKALNTEIQNYLNVRDNVLGDNHNPYLLAGSSYGGVNPNLVRRVLKRAVKTIGIYQPRRIVGRTNFSAPSAHSLRHSFAVNTLLKIKARHGSPQNALPVLAAYMGHSEYKHTVKYLKIIDACQRQGLLDFALRQKR